MTFDSFASRLQIGFFFAKYRGIIFFDTAQPYYDSLLYRQYLANRNTSIDNNDTSTNVIIIYHPG